MQKIRIGNDIRINISLVDKTEYSASNIKNIKCYLVNKTLIESMNKKCCNSQYLLNWCGCPTYHVLPHCRNKFYYNGRDFDCKCEMDKYRPLDKTKYLMESELDANNNVINAYFPSKDQICGVYQLIVVVETFVPGWGKRQLKTNTIDYGEIFEIVDKSTEQTGGITITTGVDPLINSGFIGYLAVRPFAEDEESDQDKGFDRSDDGYENPSQETYDNVGIQNVDPNLLLEVHDLSRFSTIVNYVDGQYLWVMSKKPIKNLIDGSMNNIPFTTVQYNAETGYYYYAGSNPVLKNTMSGGVSVKAIF